MTTINRLLGGILAGISVVAWVHCKWTGRPIEAPHSHAQVNNHTVPCVNYNHLLLFDLSSNHGSCLAASIVQDSAVDQEKCRIVVSSVLSANKLVSDPIRNAHHIRGNSTHQRYDDTPYNSLCS